jgi:phage terminase Nu1 subunit (DNA packaging protein)
MPFLEKADRKTGKEWEFDSVAVAEWREGRAAVNAAGNTEALDIEEAKRRKLASEAALSELELSKARGEVVPFSEVSKSWLSIVTAVRSRLLSIPTKLAMVVAPETDPVKIKLTLESEIAEALDELSRYNTGS